MDTTKMADEKEKRKYTTMSRQIRLELCQKKRDHPEMTQWALIKWLQDSYGLRVTQATVSNTLKRSDKWLDASSNLNPLMKHERPVKYPEMEKALARWLRDNEEQPFARGPNEFSRGPNGLDIKNKALALLDQLYPEHDPFMFSNGWLDGFKTRHGFRLKRGTGGVIPVKQPTLQIPAHDKAASDVIQAVQASSGIGGSSYGLGDDSHDLDMELDEVDEMDEMDEMDDRSIGIGTSSSAIPISINSSSLTSGASGGSRSAIPNISSSVGSGVGSGGGGISTNSGSGISISHSGPKAEEDDIIKAGEAIDLLWKLECFFMKNQDENHELLEALDKMRERAWKIRKVEMKEKLRGAAP